MNYLLVVMIGLGVFVAVFFAILGIKHAIEQFSDQKMQERHMKKVSRK